MKYAPLSTMQKIAAVYFLLISRETSQKRQQAIKKLLHPQVQ